MSFIDELKRRNVFKVAVAYGVAAWVLMQVADLVLEAIEAPSWVLQALLLVVGLGFVAAVVIAWAYEMTPEGIKKESEVDRSQSITSQTGRKLDRIIIGFLVVAVAVLLVERTMSPGEAPATISEPAAVTTTAAPSTPVTPSEPEPDEYSIAVLPFANRSNVEEDLFFTEGIHDDLLTQLAKITDLKVISRTSVMEYRDTTKKIPEIAGELGVSKILEGGVQRAGNRVRINAQLIDVETDEHLWAETFDREMTLDNLFDIQSEITRQIVVAVRGELTETHRMALTEAPTQIVEAYEALLRGRAAARRPDYLAENYIEAQPWLERAVELDPNFADAWAELAMLHGQARWLGIDRSPERRALAEDALARAKSLKPGDPEILLAEAEFYYRFDEDYEKALIYNLQAVEASPGDARMHMFAAITQRRAGYWEDSLQSFEKALELDPSNNFVVNQLIDTLGNMNRWEDVKFLADTYVIRFPDSQDLRSYQMQSRYFVDGDLAAARELLDQMNPQGGATYVFPAFRQALAERDWNAALAHLNDPLVREYLSVFSNNGLLHLMTAGVHDFKGDIETAKSFYRQSLEAYENAEAFGATSESFRWGGIAASLMGLGDKEGAMKASLKSLEILDAEKDHLFGSGNEQAHDWILAMAGFRDEALERISAKLNKPEGYHHRDLQLQPQWDFFRDDPRFVALYEGVE